MDVYDNKTRSAVMRAVKSKNTTLEKKVRQLLHRAGYRFCLHRKDLPGKPDLVFPSRKVVVFIHGCFWHQHQDCHRAKRPTSNTVYWNAKLNRNIERDKENVHALEILGWKVIIFWECQVPDGKAIQAIKEILDNRKSEGKSV